MLAWKSGAVAGGSDSSGYMNNARLIAASHATAPIRSVAGIPPEKAPGYLYVPLGFRPSADGAALVPTYPVGFALFIAASSALVGWPSAGCLAAVLHAVAGILASFALFRALNLGLRWALVGAVVIAASPLYLFMSLQAMSDVPSLFWTTFAVWAAITGRARSPWTLVAGFAFAVDVLLRPTNALALAPLAVALGAAPRRWLQFAAGGLPGALFLAAYNHAAYGRAITTGYGDVSGLLRLSYVPQTLVHFSLWLPALFTPLVVMAAALPWLRGVAPWIRLMLVVWMAAFSGFYSMYYCSHESWGYVRFLLPMAPALVGSALLVLQAACSRMRQSLDPARSLRTLAVALCLVLLISGSWVRHLRALNIGDGERRYGRVARWLEATTPHDAVIVCMQASGALFYFTDRTIVRWDMLGALSAEQLESAVRKSGRPLYAVLFPFELNDSGALSRHVPGDWKLVGRVDDVTVWRAGSPAPGL